MNSEVPTIGELTTEEYRQKIAGLIDPQEKQSTERRDEVKQLAIDFVAMLPEVFGAVLDRLTMWDRIATGLQVAFAKTPGTDHEHFIQQVLEHVKTDTSKAAVCKNLMTILTTLSEWSPTDRQAWITYFKTHLVPVIVHARAAWEKKKQSPKKKKKDKKSKSTNVVSDGPNPFATEGGVSE